MKTTNRIDTKLSHKAIKAARLAAGEAKIDHIEAANSQGRIAGDLAARAGITLEQLHGAVPELHAPYAAPAWSSCVDGWYDAQPSEVSELEYQTAAAAILSTEARGIMDRMWAELLRRRA